MCSWVCCYFLGKVGRCGLGVGVQLAASVLPRSDLWRRLGIMGCGFGSSLEAFAALGFGILCCAVSKNRCVTATDELAWGFRFSFG